MYIYFIVIAILSSIALCLTKTAIVEHMLTYDVDIDIGKHINVVWDKYNISEKSVEIFRKIPLTTFNERLDPTNTLYIVDAFTYRHLSRGDTKIYHVFDDVKSLALMKKRNQYPYEKLRDVSKVIKIGCPTQIHRKLFEVLCKASDIVFDDFEFIETESLDEVDVLVFYDSFNNALKTHAYQIDFISYDDINISQLKYFVPYCKIIDLPLDKYFKDYKDKFSVKRCLMIDMVLYGQKGIKYLPLLPSSKVPELNFLSMVGLTEHFEDLPIITPKHDISGTLWDTKFHLSESKIEGVPLKKDMQVIFKNQYDKRENGKYYVLSDKILVKKNNIPNARIECIDHPNIENKTSCPTHWDKRCEFDSDCPFFKDTVIGVGGCNDGYCHMPVNVKRIGYTKYEGSAYDESIFPLL